MMTDMKHHCSRPNVLVGWTVGLRCYIDVSSFGWIDFTATNKDAASLILIGPHPNVTVLYLIIYMVSLLLLTSSRSTPRNRIIYRFGG
ncbi:unnamed protein product [Prunus brigantina]